MIYIVCVAIVLSSAFIGKVLSNKIVLRDSFYKGATRLISQLKSNVIFKRESIEKTLRGFLDTLSDEKIKPYFKALIDSYISGEDINLSKQSALYFLSKEEKNLFHELFASLGEGNGEVELLMLDRLESELKEKTKDAAENRKKNEGLIYKLSIAVGIVICILIV